jgi:hypothetical protein
MLSLDRAAVEQALAALKPAFEADGARMEVGNIEDRSVIVNIFVNRTTCRECLLPAPQLEVLFRQALLESEITCNVRVIFIEN